MSITGTEQYKSVEDLKSKKNKYESSYHQA